MLESSPTLNVPNVVKAYEGQSFFDDWHVCNVVWGEESEH
jgi:hypothetical protein